MYQFIVAAFLMGMTGSFHCLGMCGPLALSLPLKTENTYEKFSSALIYNFGRIISYSFLGLIIGTLGAGMKMAGLQQWLSIFAGMFIIVFMVIPHFTSLHSTSFFAPFFEFIRNHLGKLFFKKDNRSLLFIGMLNGFLPCGFVYLAFAGAIAAGGVVQSVLFMAFFGAGTLPMMWSVAFFGKNLGLTFSHVIRKTYPYLMITIASLLILRGMGLGIPYISPSVQMGSDAAVHSCCHKH